MDSCFILLLFCTVDICTSNSVDVEHSHMIDPRSIAQFESSHRGTRELHLQDDNGEVVSRDSQVDVAVVVDPDDRSVADKLAESLGMVNKGPVGGLRGIHIFSYYPSEKEKRGEENPVDILLRSPQVLWAEKQRNLIREKRGSIRRDFFNEFLGKMSGTPEDYLKSMSNNFMDNSKPKTDLPRAHVGDPSFPDQWYILNTGQTGGPAEYDSKIVPVWNMGYTGKGVVVTVLDDGVDHKNPDLSVNYDPAASFDINDNDYDPSPDDRTTYNGHGTKCAGIISSAANNNFCGVGIAYNSRIGGIRMLDGSVNDAVEASSLSFNPQHVDIYTCSWGPTDDGKTFGRPGKLTATALKDGVKYGRRGKGSIFVWAIGNGGVYDDDCNADGYANSIYTLSIGSISDRGVSTYYDEKCAPMHAVTYTSGSHQYGSYRNKMITTFLYNQCTDTFTGTSAAAPEAAAITALVLEANPNLTWRDVQHLVVNTARKINFFDKNWVKNAAGYLHSNKFGFGVLDAEAMVKQALNWTQVSEMHQCEVKANTDVQYLPIGGFLKMSVQSDGCQKCKTSAGQAHAPCDGAVDRLEHVQLTVSFKHHRRGDLEVALVSPSGTTSHLLQRRSLDSSTTGLRDWTLSTLAFWGENPSGTWSAIFSDASNSATVTTKRDIETTVEELIGRVGPEELPKLVEKLNKAKSERELRSYMKRVYPDVAAPTENLPFDDDNPTKREQLLGQDLNGLFESTQGPQLPVVDASAPRQVGGIVYNFTLTFYGTSQRSAV